MQLAVLSGQALDRGDGDAVKIAGEHQAGIDELAVHDDEAGPAIPMPAAFLDAGQEQPVTQDLQQAFPGGDRQTVGFTVHRHCHMYVLHQQLLLSCAARERRVFVNKPRTSSFL